MDNQIFRGRNGQNLGGRGLVTCRGKDSGGGTGKGKGGGNKPGSGPTGNCVCPKCGKKSPHVTGQRCMDQVCPDCGTKMIRG
ncbi:MAG: hypothetical protein ABIJ65_03020 [Chloroflexota bacterium]